MHLEKPAYEIDPEAEALYHPDGRVNFDAVEAFLEETRGEKAASKASPLDEVTDSSMEVDFDLVNKLEATDVADALNWLGRPGTSEYALNHYIVYTIGQQIHKARVTANPEFKKNPDFVPDLRSEITRALSDVLPLGSSGKDTKLPPASWPVENLRCIIAIPNAGLQETNNIYTTLQQYALQDPALLSLDQYEIVIHNNFAIDESADHAVIQEDLNRTLEEIKRFQHDYPHIHVRQFGTRYEGKSISMGTVRADLFNAIGQDMYNRGRQNDILIISNDADTIALSPEYLSDMVEAFERSRPDVIATGLDWELLGDLPDDAVANNLLRYQMYLDDISNKFRQHPRVWDASTGVSLATYFAVGGFRRGRKQGEMFGLVDNIRTLRKGSSQEFEILAQKARLTTNSRRLVEAMALGFAPYEAWEDHVTGFSHDDELRTSARRSDQAEVNAQQKWREWIHNMETQPGLQIPEAIRSRVLGLGKLVVGLCN